MSKFDSLHMTVIRWLEEKGIAKNSTGLKQFTKGTAERGELAQAILDNDIEAIMDGIGDSWICDISTCLQFGIDPVDCLELAVNVVTKRKGEMKNGIFVKEQNE